VIESDQEPNHTADYGNYRCHSEFRCLIDWLRTKGVTSKTPLHSLRKEFGSQINARYGLTAAQEMLRHANVAVTAAHYVENKQRGEESSNFGGQRAKAFSFDRRGKKLT
jgi:hypothetical protein